MNEEIKKSEEEIKEVEETDVLKNCENCGKVIYKNELCSCKKEDDIK